MLVKLSTGPRSAVRRRVTVGALALVLLGTALPALADDGEDAPGLARFYDQKIRWGRCEGLDAPADLQCGKVTVPLDYARPKAGTLDLALARYRATGDSRGSVLLNFGGPGGSGVSELASGGKDFMHLTNGYDVVGFDPRGVGRSSPVSCGPGSVEIMEATDGDENLRDPKDVLRQLRRAADACAEHSGPVLPHIGTVNASRDMDVMRAALGDGKLNYLGFSYGTRLGAVYAAQFPTRWAAWCWTAWTPSPNPWPSRAWPVRRGSRPRWRTSSTGAPRTSPAPSARTPGTPGGRWCSWSARWTRTRCRRPSGAVYRAGPGGRHRAGPVQPGAVALAVAGHRAAGGARRHQRPGELRRRWLHLPRPAGTGRRPHRPEDVPSTTCRRP